MAGSTWCKSDVNRSFFLCLAACRTRSSACDTLARSCARRVLCWSAFPLVPALGSPGSAADRSALFVGFPATTSAGRRHLSVIAVRVMAAALHALYVEHRAHLRGRTARGAEEGYRRPHLANA